MAVMTPHARGGPNGGSGGGLLSGLPALVAVAAAALVALCACAAALFVFRTPLRVWLHSRYGLRVLGDAAAADRKDCGGGGGGGSEDRLYDALVSCSVKDQGWDQIRLPKNILTNSRDMWKFLLKRNKVPILVRNFLVTKFLLFPK